MNVFGSNVLLAVAWVAFTGEVTLPSLLVGFVIGYMALWLIQPLIGSSSYFRRVIAWIRLVVMFFFELIISSIAVTFDVITPTHRASPAIVDMPLDVKSDFGILLVTNLISLTPGTLSLDVSPDRKTLKVHAMFVDDPDALCRDLKAGMERWVIDAAEA